MTETQKIKRADTFRTAALLFQYDEDPYGYPARPGTLRPPLRATRVG